MKANSFQRRVGACVLTVCASVRVCVFVSDGVSRYVMSCHLMPCHMIQYEVIGCHMLCRKNEAAIVKLSTHTTLCMYNDDDDDIIICRMKNFQATLWLLLQKKIR